MFIKRLVIRNFKSIKELSVELGKINVLVGPNGAGKSNVVDSLLLVKEIIRPTSLPPYPFIRWGNYRDVVFMQDEDLDISFELEGDTGKGGFSYSVVVNGKNDFMIKEERLRVGGHEILRELNEFTVDGKRGGSLERYMSVFSTVQRVGSLRFVSSQAAIPEEALEFLESFCSSPNMTIVGLRVNPEQVLAPVPPVFPLTLRVDGFGTPKVLMALREMPGALREFLEENGISLRYDVSAEGNIVMSMEEAAEGKGKLALRASSVPWGMAKMLSIMAAIAAFPSSLIVIDEVENSLHLKFMERLVDVFRQSDGQFILTTHSPLLIDLVNPDEVILVQREGWETVASRFKDVQRLMKELKKSGITLSEYILYRS